MRRQEQCECVWWCSRAGECGQGGAGGCVDTASVKLAVVNLSTETVSVGVVRSSQRQW